MPHILYQLTSSGYRLRVGGQPGQEQAAVPQGSPGLFLSQNQSKSNMATGSAKTPQGEQETERVVSEAKKILIKALLRFLSACGLRSAHRSQSLSPGRKLGGQEEFLP